MGAFESKKRTAVGTSVVRVVADELLPSPIRKAILTSIFREEELTPSFMDSALNSSVIRYENAYRYAARGDYYYGLPNATVISNTPNSNLVIPIIEAETGLTISLEYLKYGALNHSHEGWRHVTDNFGYNPETNELETLSSSTGFTVYLDKVLPTYFMEAVDDEDTRTGIEFGHSSLAGHTPERPNSSDTLAQYVPATLYRTGENETDGVEVHYIWEDNGTIQRGSVFIDLSTYGDTEDFFHCRYVYTDGQGINRWGHWTYETGLGTHPSLDLLNNPEYTNPGTYFPFLFFRRGRSNATRESQRETPQFLSSEKLAKYFGMNYIQISDEIHSNPDISDVDQAVMMMGVPGKTEDQLELRYLFSFFDRLRQETQTVTTVDQSNLYPTQASKTDQVINLQYNRPPEHPYAINIRDADFRMTISFIGIQRFTRTGTIGEVGELVSSTANIRYEYIVLNEVNENITTSYDKAYTAVNLIYQRQLTPTIYEELIVIDPTLRYDIYQRYGVNAKATSEEFLIPLDHALVNQFTLVEKEVLYNRSLHFVFNSRVVTKVEWYQTSAFVKFITVVVVIITLATGGAGSFLQSLATALTVGLTATVLFLLEVFVQVILIRYAFKITVKELGTEFALALAVIAAAASITTGPDGLWNLASITPQMLLFTVNGLVQGIGDVLGDQFASLESDVEIFKEKSEGLLEELERAQELLQQDNLIDPLLFTEVSAPLMVTGESSTDFYERTIHSGNIGTMGVELIHEFVPLSTRLPDINETLGGFR